MGTGNNFGRRTMHVKTKKVIGIILIFIAMIFMVCILVLSYKSLSMGLFVVKTNGNPCDTVNEYFSNMVSGNYAMAASLLKGCDSISLTGNNEESEDVSLLREALLNSYSFEIQSDLFTDKLTASVSVIVTSLDTKLVITETEKKIGNLLNEKVELLPKDELYDDEGNYLISVLDQVYIEALKETLLYSDELKCSKTVMVHLSYEDERWLIDYDEELVSVFSGE